MLGLKYLRTLNEISLQNVADRIGVTKQTVSKWEKGKVIPPERLKELSHLFNVNEEYLLKELSDIDKLEIQKVKLRNALKKIEISETMADNTTGKETTTIREYTDIEDMLELSKIDYKISRSKLINKIEQSLDKCLENIDGDEDLVIAALGNANELLRFYKDFVYLINNPKVNRQTLREIMRAIKTTYISGFITDSFTKHIVEEIKKHDEKYKKDKK